MGHKQSKNSNFNDEGGTNYYPINSVRSAPSSVNIDNSQNPQQFQSSGQIDSQSTTKSQTDSQSSNPSQSDSQNSSPSMTDSRRSPRPPRPPRPQGGSQIVQKSQTVSQQVEGSQSELSSSPRSGSEIRKPPGSPPGPQSEISKSPENTQEFTFLKGLTTPTGTQYQRVALKDGTASISLKKSREADPVLIDESGRLKPWEVSLSEMKMILKLGSGASGEVYLTLWKNKKVALKKLKDDFTKSNLQEFTKEAELLASIKPHPNVALFLGVVLHPPCIITQYYPHGSLEGYLENRKNVINQGQVKKMAREIAAGMAHLHSARIIHRDLASRNLLLDEGYVIKISDFGMSRMIIDGSKGNTQSEIGPLKWMAPESIMNREYSPKSDVYMYSMTLVEILNREKPFGNEPPVETAVKVTQEGLRPELPQDTDPILVELIQYCWDAFPENRPFFSDILRFLDTGLWNR